MEPEGLSGRLVFWWKESMVVKVAIDNKNLINTRVMEPNSLGLVRIFWTY